MRLSLFTYHMTSFLRNDKQRNSNDRYIGWLHLTRKKFKYKLKALDYTENTEIQMSEFVDKE